MTKETKQLDLFEWTEKLLKCNKCGELKPCSEFGKRNDRKRGYQYKCKDCCKQYREDNAEQIKQRIKQWCEDNAEQLKQKKKQWQKDNDDHLKQYNKQYNEDNAEYRKQYKKQWYEDNIEYNKQKSKQWYKDNIEQSKQYNISPFKLDDTTQKLEEIKKYESYIIDEDNDINFKCAYCGIYYKTTRQEVSNRLRSINNTSQGESRFYCSDQCKEECPIFHQQLYTKDNKPEASSREVQPQLRQMVLKRDNYTCQKCKKHKDKLSVGLHCHHIWPLNESPITSADIDECITYCKDCHVEVHKTVPGCGYAEMKCSVDHNEDCII